MVKKSEMCDDITIKIDLNKREMLDLILRVISSENRKNCRNRKIKEVDVRYYESKIKSGM